MKTNHGGYVEVIETEKVNPEEYSLAKVSRIQALAAKERKGHVFFNSKFKMFNAHNGIRRKKTHLFLSGTGDGKSTFIRSMVLDLTGSLTKDERALIWLSEESREDFVEQFEATGAFYCPEDQRKYMEPLDVVSEIDLSMENKNAGSVFLSLASSGRYKIVLFDNLTTSSIYEDLSVSQQGVIATKLKAMSVKYDFALFVVAHTGSKSKMNQGVQTDANDIRGSRKIVNLSEFTYILTSVRCNGKIFPIVQIRKHRGYTVDRSYYLLCYSHEQQIYKGDLSITYDMVKAYYNQRDQLGK